MISDGGSLSVAAASAGRHDLLLQVRAGCPLVRESRWVSVECGASAHNLRPDSRFVSSRLGSGSPTRSGACGRRLSPRSPATPRPAHAPPWTSPCRTRREPAPRRCRVAGVERQRQTHQVLPDDRRKRERRTVRVNHHSIVAPASSHSAPIGSCGIAGAASQDLYPET